MDIKLTAPNDSSVELPFKADYAWADQRSTYTFWYNVSKTDAMTIRLRFAGLEDHHMTITEKDKDWLRKNGFGKPRCKYY